MSEPIPQRDIRTSFDIAARFYKWRAPYPAKLFRGACGFLKLDRNAAVLDICCGSGELAAGFANHVGRVVGIDFSERMLALAPRHERIDYIRHDINAPPLPAILRDTKFDCFTIGRAIHWIDGASLALAVEQNLDPKGYILICGSGFGAETPWIGAFRRLRKAYSHDEGEKDHTGEQKLGRLGFGLFRHLSSETTARLTVGGLVRHAMSYGRAAEAIHRNLPRFKAELADAVGAYLEDGKLTGKVISWMTVYRRRGQVPWPMSPVYPRENWSG